MRRADRPRDSGGARSGAVISAGKLNDVDHGRGERTGVPEVVLALGKPDEALIDAVASLLESHQVLVTKPSAVQVSLLEREFGPKVARKGRLGGTLVIGALPPPPPDGKVAVVSAGSSDLAVAEEACIAAEYLALQPFEIRDCGVAGLHRTQRAAERIARESPDAIIAIAGMEGALPSILASLVPQPLIAVPTSVGYGTGAGGLAALMAMLNTCVPGVVVVNIDNGFGAAAAARRMVPRSRSVNRQ